MARQIRKVPKNWKHPKSECGYEPLDEDSIPSGSWYQLFEDVTEGTPLSPPFKTKRELVEWLSNNKDFWGYTRTYEEAEATVKRGWSPSGVIIFDF